MVVDGKEECHYILVDGVEVRKLGVVQSSEGHIVTVDVVMVTDEVSGSVGVEMCRHAGCIVLMKGSGSLGLGMAADIGTAVVVELVGTFVGVDGNFDCLDNRVS